MSDETPADVTDEPPVYRQVLWNESEGRPRAPWRLLAWFVLALALGVMVSVPVTVPLLLAGDATLGRWFPGVAPDAVVVVGATVGQNLGLVLASLVAAVVIDRRKLADLGLGFDREWGLELVVGFALGAVFVLAVLAVELAAGWVTVTGTVLESGTDLPTALLFGVLFLVASTGEEVVFRGYVLTNIAEGVNGFGSVGPTGASAAAVGATSLLFGVVHVANPGGGVVGGAVIVLAGVLLGTAYVLTDSLALPVGFHVGWNWFQGQVVGFPVSGLVGSPSLLELDQHGPEMFTGGSFGPEAGLVGAVAFLAGIAAVLGWARLRRGSLGVSPEFAEPLLR